MRLVTDWNNYIKYVMKPNFKDIHFRMSYLLQRWEKPPRSRWVSQYTLAGQYWTILKLLYEFHCDYMQPRYGIKINVCLMDTGSFVYE